MALLVVWGIGANTLNTQGAPKRIITLLMREASIRVEAFHLEESPIRIISYTTCGVSVKIIMWFSSHLGNQTIK